MVSPVIDIASLEIKSLSPQSGSYFRLRRKRYSYQILSAMNQIDQEFLDFFIDIPINQPRNGSRLLLKPTTHGENFDIGFAPIPTSPDELPEPERFTLAYIVSVIEVILGKRQLRQIARNTHRFVYDSISNRIGTLSDPPKIQRIHRSYPIEGAIEVVTTLRFKTRIRALVFRFEGVDGRWLCTEFDLL